MFCWAGVSTRSPVCPTASGCTTSAVSRRLSSSCRRQTPNAVMQAIVAIIVALWHVHAIRTSAAENQPMKLTAGIAITATFMLGSLTYLAAQGPPAAQATACASVTDVTLACGQQGPEDLYAL